MRNMVIGRSERDHRYVTSLEREETAEKVLHAVVKNLQYEYKDLDPQWTSIDVIDDMDEDESLDLAVNIKWKQGHEAELFIQESDDDMDEYYLTVNCDDGRIRSFRAYSVVDLEVSDEFETLMMKVKTALNNFDDMPW